MRPTSSRPRSSKSGVSTILGTLIFVGILFSVVIPLFLYVNQVNNLYDKTMIERRQLDQQRLEEEADVYAYPISSSSDKLNIYIKNKRALSMRIVRIWVNDAKIPLVVPVTGMGEDTSQIQVTLPDSGTRAYRVKVITERGNIFSSLTNPLYYTTGSGGEGSGWSGGIGFTIQVVIETATPQSTRFFHVDVTGPSNYYWGVDVVKRSRESSCFAAVTVTLAGNYYLTVKEGSRIVADNWPVPVDLSRPSQWVYVNAG